MCAFAVVILLFIDRDYYFNSLITVYLATATLVLWLIALPDYLMKDWGLGGAAWLHKRPSDDKQEEPDA